MADKTLKALILLLLLFCTTAHSAEFKISPPNQMATIAMPCWHEKQVTVAFKNADFEPVVQGLLVEKTDPAKPLVTVWLHALTGRGAVVISHPTGEECIALVLDEAQ